MGLAHHQRIMILISKADVRLKDLKHVQVPWKGLGFSEITDQVMARVERSKENRSLDFDSGRLARAGILGGLYAYQLDVTAITLGP